MVDMTNEEKQIMHQHVAYWKPYVEDGTVIVLGPVMGIQREVMVWQWWK
jgi:hypothetical protein